MKESEWKLTPIEPGEIPLRADGTPARCRDIILKYCCKICAAKYKLDYPATIDQFELNHPQPLSKACRDWFLAHVDTHNALVKKELGL